MPQTPPSHRPPAAHTVTQRFQQEMRVALERAHEDVFALRDVVMSAPLAHLDTGTPRDIEIAFQAPDREMLLEETASLAYAYAESLGDEDAITQQQQQLVDDFLRDNHAGTWQQSREHGALTIHYREVAADAPHPVNPDESSLEYLDAGDMDESIISIDGRPFHFHNSELLADHLAETVKLRDALEIVENEGQGHFGTIISVVEDDVASVGYGHSLAVGRPMLELSAHNFGELLNTLRHERGHVIHGDVDIDHDRNRVFSALQSASLPLHALELLSHSSEWAAERLADVTTDNDEALEQIAALDAALDTLTPQIGQLAERIRAYPWYDELDAMSVAADMDNDTSLIAHLRPRSAQDTTLEAAGDALTATTEFYHLLDPFEDEDYEDLDNDHRVDALHQAINRLTAKHADLLENIREVHITTGYISQAQEYLADLHSVVHAEQPETVADSYAELAQKLDISAGGEPGDSHPSDVQRIDAIGHFTRRVLFERARQQQSPQQNSHER